MKKKYLVLIPLVLVIFAVGKTLSDANFFYSAQSVNEEKCKSIGKVHGPEDIEKLNDRYLLISSGYHEPLFEKGKHQGGLYQLDTKTNEILPLTDQYSVYFNPHGIEVYTTPEGDVIVYAINHSEKKDYIELFHWVPGSLTHLRTFQSDLLYNANDLVAIESGEVYITIDHGAKSHLGKTLENFTQWGMGKVLLFHDQEFQLVMDGLSFANGIEYDPDSKTLYLAETLKKKIHRLEIKDKKTLVAKSPLQLDVFPDNLIYSEDHKALYIGAHSKILTLSSHSKDPSVDSPSEVLKVKGDKVSKVLQLTSRMGSGISVATTASTSLFLGNIYRDSITECPYEN